ncbi:hypothetical protein HPB51_014178 [Rhipicephalus microplus]|uniref:Uncharacterized protein n=1 Tax=Rhipicephalus microplus TaxID=6941 RepID=A0A9J6E0Z0_RHIMP|nr:hypothetical protein HPB51_014178 [Rhipicephalus microplus]
MTSQRSNPRAGACSAHHRPSSHFGSFRRRLDDQAATSGPPGVGHAFRDTSCEVIIAKAEHEDCPFYEIPPRDHLNPMEVSDNDDHTNFSKHSVLSEDLEHMLGDGRYELEALFSVTCARFVMLCHNHLHNVAAPHVDHKCRPPAEYSDPTLAQWRSVSELEHDPGQPRCCERFVPPISVLTANRYTLPRDSVVHDASSYSCTVIGDWNLASERGWLQPASFAVHMWGAALESLVTGHVTDKVGRLQVTLITTFGLIGCRMGVCSTDTFLTFAALRFGVAAFVCRLQLTTYLVLFEVKDRTRRTLYCVAATGLCLTLSPVFVYALTELSRSWVATQVVVKLPTTLLRLVVVYVAKESGRRLLTMVEVSWADKATFLTARLRRDSCLHDALVDWRLHTSQARRKPSRSAQLSYYSHVTMRARFSGGSAEVFWLKSATVMLKIPSSVATYLSVWRLGRRSALWLLLCLLSLMARMAAVMLAVRGYHDNAAIFLYALTGVLVNQFVMLLFTYSVEVFPTDTSGAAVFVVDFCGRLGAPSKPVLRPLFRFAGLGGSTVARMALLSL